MPIFSQLMFRAVHWAARRGLRGEESFSNDAKKQELGAPACEEKPMHTGICRSKGTYS
jgi:hypothetical protein